MKKVFIIYILFNFCLKYCVSKKYDKYKLYRGIPVNESHLEFFKNLGDKYEVNFWRDPGMMYMPVEFLIAPKDIPDFIKEAEKGGIYLTTIIEDVQKAFDMQTVKTYIRRKMDSFDWHDYFRIADIYQWLEDLAKSFPEEMSVTSIGKTYEKRDILAVRILLKESLARSTVIVEGGIHAREWISPAFVTYLIHQILHSKDLGNQGLRRMALTYEWYFVPVLNPDGYEYTFTQDRMWRKNRQYGEGFYGVDLNRNFDTAFGTVGVSMERKQEIYCGKTAFSEKETTAMASLVQSHGTKIEYYLSFHAYGQYMIIPYAYLKTHEDNFDEVNEMCRQAAHQIAFKYGTKYTYGTAYDTVARSTNSRHVFLLFLTVETWERPMSSSGMVYADGDYEEDTFLYNNGDSKRTRSPSDGYITSGVSGCWVKQTYRVPYVITFELRDDGKHGFALPPSEIMPACKETLDGVISLLTPRSHQYHKLIQKPIPYANKHSYSVLQLNDILFAFNVLSLVIDRFY